MQIDLKPIKRKVLETHPFFGGLLVNTKFVETEEIDTIGTDGNYIYYNPNYFNELSLEDQAFMVNHELCHIQSKHIERGKDKDDELWNIATDAVVNALLKIDGLTVVKDGIDIEEEIKSSAETIYEKLQKKEVEIPKSQKVIDNHDLWHPIKYVIVEREKSNGKENEQEEIDEELDKQMEELAKSLQDENKESLPRLVGEVEGVSSGIPWQRILRNEVDNKEEWSYINAIIRDGIIRPQRRKFPSAEAEIVVDTSGSVNEQMLINFIIECREIFNRAEIKVGFFDDKFYGFNTIRSLKDIDELDIKGGGGTDFDEAVNAFTGKVKNKIIFTDGWANEPKKPLDAIWIIFDEKRKIKPKGAKKVINLTKKQIEDLNMNSKDYER